MKRILPWIVGLGAVGAIAVLAGRGQGRPITTPVPQPPAQQATTPAASVVPPGEEKIVYTFSDDAKIQEFAGLWQQRQATLLRQTVLQAYLNQEQANVTQLNDQLAADYQVDVTKNYFLDGQRKALLERPIPPTPPAPTELPAEQATQPAEAPATPTEPTTPPGEEKVVYTFPDDAKIQEFAERWQQRQATVIRLSVLQAYLNQEQTNATQLNEKLAADYQVDVTKNYFLDGQRKVLLERPTPPEPAQPATPPTQ